MSTSREERITIPDLKPKLSDGGNYPEWARKLKIHLSIHQLLPLVDGTSQSPSTLAATTKTATIENDIRKWQRVNDLALTFMIQNSEGTAESIILMEDNAHTAWESLQGTTANLTALLHAVIKLQFNNCVSTIDEHINKFQIRWAQLASTVAGSTDTTKSAGTYAVVTKCDSAKAQILLGTLPNYYKMVVKNIALQTENPTYHDVTVQLRDLITKTLKTAKNTESTLTNPTAFTIQSTKAKQTCDYCRKKKGWSGRGHIEAECRTKRREAQSNHQAYIAATKNNDEYCDRAFVTHTSTSANSMDWQYDSVCTVHITPYLNLLHQAEPHRIQVCRLSGSTWSTHQGSTITQDGRSVTFHNVLFVPDAPENLFSGQVLISNNVFPVVHDRNPRLDYNGKTVLKMTLANGKQMIHGSESVALITSEVNAQDWHVRYRHLPLPAFRHILEAPPALRNAKLEYSTCQKGKSTKAPSGPSGHRANRILDTLHSDLCGPLETQGVIHQRYICTLIDEYSQFTMLRSLPSKAEAPATLLDMIAAMETQTGYKAKNLKTDNGGEYRSAELLHHLRAKGISLKETVAYHSQTNAIAERTNRTIVTMAQTALLHANLPKYLWPEVVAHSTYTKN